MISRLFWMTAGAAAGVLAFRRAERAVEAVTPQGIARSLSEAVSDLAYAIGEFAQEVRAGMAEREQELRTTFGPISDPALPAGARQRAIAGGRPPLADEPTTHSSPAA